MTGTTPGHCSTVAADTPPEGPIVLVDGARDGPWVSECGYLAGWEVELPTKTVGGAFSRRDTLLLTSLPHGLAKVMGEEEYQEQVLAIRELTKAHSKRLGRLKFIPLVLIIACTLLAFATAGGGLILLYAGFISEDAFFVFFILTIIEMSVAVPVIFFSVAYAWYRAGMAGKTMGYEIDRATAHWEARGIAWRLKTSNPEALLTTGKNAVVAAVYSLRVYVECAPDAIELFQTHGPFPTSRAVPSHGIERYSDYGSITAADRGSDRYTGGPDGTPKFALAFTDIFFNKIRHVVPKRPMMLRNVMGANEFAEQVGVINRDMDRLSKPWKISCLVFCVSCAAVLPSILLGTIPPALWARLELGGSDWLPFLLEAPFLALPFIGIFGGLHFMFKTQESSEKKLAAILETQAERWEVRGIEWFLSTEMYRLTVGGASSEHTERRVTVRVRPEAADKFRMLGPFPPGEIDSAACVTYDLSAF